MKNFKKHLTFILAISLAFSACKKDLTQPEVSNANPSILSVTKASASLSTTNDDSNILLGNPDGAQSSVTANKDNYLMDKTYYVLSYNSSKGTPNWVSWHLQKSDMGTENRQNDFRADTALPSGWYQVQNSSYSKTGFDKGHNCNSADRTSTKEANSSTFLMSNMIPQAPQNNQQTWKNLEDYTRKLVNDGNEAYVICGSYGQGGVGSASSDVIKTIDNGKIVVPSNFWKIIVVIPDGKNDLGRIDTKAQVIVVNTPNNNNLDKDWTKYITTVTDIENRTKYNFFTSITNKDVLVALKKQKYQLPK